MKQIFQYPPSQNKVTFSWCQLCDVNSELHYCTEVDVQIPNKKILSLIWCQQIDYYCAVHIYTQINVQISNKTVYLLEWWRVSKKNAMSLFRKHFNFYWPLEILHPKFPMFPCSSSKYILKFNKIWIYIIQVMWITRCDQLAIKIIISHACQISV